MDHELVSVLMTVYKENLQELKKSFESILNQTYKNLEIIVIIDNPEDNFREKFLNQFKDDRVIIIKNSKNIGLPLSLNNALAMAKGDLIARMDADDESRLDRIEKQVAYMKRYNYDLVGSYVTYSYMGKMQETVKFPTNPDIVRDFLKYKSAVLHPTWLVKKKVFKRLNGYRNIPSVEDYDFLIRASLKGFRISNFPEVLYDVSLSEKSISRSNPGKQELIAEYIRNAYKDGVSPAISDIDSYIHSSTFLRKTNDYNRYCRLKDKRARRRDKKAPIYYIYSLRLLANFRHSSKDVMKRVMIRKYMSKDKVLGHYE